jgi:hypothetical protein
VWRGRATPATRSLLFFGAGRGRGKRLLRNPVGIEGLYVLLAETRCIFMGT